MTVLISTLAGYLILVLSPRRLLGGNSGYLAAWDCKVRCHSVSVSDLSYESGVGVNVLVNRQVDHEVSTLCSSHQHFCVTFARGRHFSFTSVKAFSYITFVFSRVRPCDVALS